MLRTALADEPFEKFEVTLRRFNLQETGRICHEMAPGEDWTDERIHDVYMQTEGNPYFIRELLKYKSDGMIGDGSPYKNAYVSMIELLDDDERLFLEAIAVCPECASMKEIAQVLAMSPLRVSKLYNDLRLHGFLREQEADEGDVLYYFTHTKIREALLEGIFSTATERPARASTTTATRRGCTSRSYTGACASSTCTSWRSTRSSRRS